MLRAIVAALVRPLAPLVTRTAHSRRAAWQLARADAVSSTSRRRAAHAAPRLVPLAALVTAVLVGGACSRDLVAPTGAAPRPSFAVAAGAGGVATPQVGVGPDHSCALRSDGQIVCWGDNTTGAASPTVLPAGIIYTAVSAGPARTCAVRSDGQIACWGNNSGNANTPAPLPAGVTYTAVSPGNIHTCALRSDGQVVCWGSNAFDQLTPPTLPTGVRYTAVSAARTYNCALRSDGQVVCWGRDIQPTPATLPAGITYTAVSAGLSHTCAMRSDGRVACWGYDFSGEATPTPLPAGLTYTMVSAGAGRTCALRSDGRIVCWGSDEDGGLAVPSLPADVTYIAVSIAKDSTSASCALRSDGRVVCWGSAAAPPEDLRLFAAAAQAITFTSTPPSPATVGGTYTVAATGGGSGNPVTFSSLTPGVCTVTGSTVRFVDVGACTVAADQAGNATYAAAPQVTQPVAVVYPFEGFLTGVRNPPTVNVIQAGRAVLVRFRLGGNRGLAVLAAGAPSSRPVACTGAASMGSSTPLPAPVASGLRYDAAAGLYVYTWQTERAWAGTCREFVLTLKDGTVRTARFQFA